MKKNRNIIFGLLALLFVSVSCTDNSEEYLFKDNPNARFEKLKNDYVNTLTSAENGWIGYYAPNDKVGGYVLLMKFDKDGNVTMSSDYNQGGNDNTSTYRIDKKLKVQLVLETHAVLHQIYETNQNGVEGEYVFNILSVTDDTVELESATDFGYGGSSVTKLTLKKADAEHWNLEKVYNNLAGLNAGDADFMTFMDYSKKRIYVKDTEVSKTFEFVFDRLGAEINRFAKITTVDAEGNETIEEVPVLINHDGFSFAKPYKINGVEVKDFTYDETTKVFTSQDGGQTTIIENTGSPIKEDVDALTKIKKWNYSAVYSDKFTEDYLNPLRAIIPNMSGGNYGVMLYNKSAFGDGTIYSRITIFEQLGGDTRDDWVWNNAYFEEMKKGARADVFTFANQGAKYKKWKDLEAQPAMKKFYDFFFAPGQEFFIEHMSFGGFILYDRDKPEYWIYFKN